LCTPGMGVNLWGESPLYWNRCRERHYRRLATQVLAEGKGGRVTDRPKEAGGQRCEATNRKAIQGRATG
jgi:hypothetical protein